MKDGHDIGPRLVDLPVDVHLEKLILARPGHGAAVEIVLDQGVDRGAARRHGAGDEVAVGIVRVTYRHVARGIEDADLGSR
jgi:hypothetical protein